MFFYRVRCYALASLVGLALLAGSVALLKGAWVSFDPANLCERGETEDCFETQPGLVRGGDGSTEMEVSPIGGEPERVVAYDSWDETPPPGTSVALERWEGNEIAFVSVPGSGSRYKTNGAPDRESPVVFALILAVLAVVLPVQIVRAAL